MPEEVLTILIKLLNLDCKIYSMEYSGHWTRYEEQAYDSMEDCIESLYSEIEEIVTETDEIFFYWDTVWEP